MARAQCDLGGARPSVRQSSSMVWSKVPGRTAAFETSEVRLIAFGEVDAAFAADEGEGDGSLTWWRSAHRAYFGRVCGRLGGQLDDATLILCRRFRLLYQRP